MPKKRRKLDVFCQNPECKCYNKKDLKNVIRFGKKQNGTQNYKCTECGTQFVRTKGTIFYHKKLKKEDVAEISRHIVETNSFRGIARETKHNKNTICSYSKVAGSKAPLFRATFESKNASVKLCFRAGIPNFALAKLWD